MINIEDGRTLHFVLIPLFERHLAMRSPNSPSHALLNVIFLLYGLPVSYPFYDG
jgi:hypothetical protein